MLVASCSSLSFINIIDFFGEISHLPLRIIQAARAYAVAGRYATAARLYEAAKHIREAIENFLRAVPWSLDQDGSR